MGIGVGIYLIISSLSHYRSNIALCLMIILTCLLFFTLGGAMILAFVWLTLLPTEIMTLDETHLSWNFVKDKGTLRYVDIAKISYYDGSLIIGGFTYQIRDKNFKMHTLRLACGNSFQRQVEIEEILKRNDIELISDWRLR